MTPSPAPRPVARHDSRVLLVSLGLPVALVSIALGIVIAWLPQLPPTVAVHWGPAGPDGFADRTTLPVLLAVFGFGLPLLLGGLVVVTSRAGFGWVQKGLAILSLGISVLLAVLFVGVTALQRGLDDVAKSPGALPVLGIALPAALVAGAIAWVVLPKSAAARSDWRAAQAMPLGAGERAVWLGSARFPVPAIVAILLPTLVIAAVTSWAAAERGGGAWALLVIPVVVFLLVLASTDWRVRVDAAGLRVRSILGLPAWSIPVADIAEAGTSTVAALSEFGGWGVRWSRPGRMGVITRSGSALEVRRRDGRCFVVTVDDAESAAALLSARIGARG